MPSGVYKRTIKRGGWKLSDKHKSNLSRIAKEEWASGKRKGGWNHSEETKKQLSKIKKGQIPWSKGLTKKTNKILKVLSEKKKGKHVSLATEFKKGHKQPKEWVEKQRKKVSGDKNWNWKGGKLVFRKGIGTIYWDKLRRSVYKRDNWTCQECGCKNKPVQCHHIIPYRWWINKKWADDLINLTTLCFSCHMKEERAIDKLVN